MPGYPSKIAISMRLFLFYTLVCLILRMLLYCWKRNVKAKNQFLLCASLLCLHRTCFVSVLFCVILWWQFVICICRSFIFHAIDLLWNDVNITVKDNAFSGKIWWVKFRNIVNVYIRERLHVRTYIYRQLLTAR